MINHRLTKDQRTKLYDQALITKMGGIYQDVNYYSVIAYAQEIYHAKFVPNPYPYGSLKFESEKHYTMFLLKI